MKIGLLFGQNSDVQTDRDGPRGALWPRLQLTKHFKRNFFEFYLKNGQKPHFQPPLAEGGVAGTSS